ncbi:hypothetical protein N0V88_003148 [Collariella sp. IMI 366227]|nr:hypothetical protein N0V88_003148 [Collariella sp. IMI 366227]
MASSRRDYQNVSAIDIDDDDLIDPDDASPLLTSHPIQPKLTLPPQPTSTPSTTPSIHLHILAHPLTGTIGSSSSRNNNQPSGSASSWTSRIPGEDRAAPLSTIDESVWATLRRDLLAVWLKMREVLYPRHLFSAWGDPAQSLRGASFAQSICVIGYTLFPLVIAALLSAVNLHWIARIPVYLVLVAWSLAAGVSILGGSGVVKNRVGLAVYPLFVFYLGLGCLCFIS